MTDTNGRDEWIASPKAALHGTIEDPDGRVQLPVRIPEVVRRAPVLHRVVVLTEKFGDTIQHIVAGTVGVADQDAAQLVFASEDECHQHLGNPHPQRILGHYDVVDPSAVFHRWAGDPARMNRFGACKRGSPGNALKTLSPESLDGFRLAWPGQHEQ